MQGVMKRALAVHCQSRCPVPAARCATLQPRESQCVPGGQTAHTPLAHRLLLCCCGLSQFAHSYHNCCQRPVSHRRHHHHRHHRHRYKREQRRRELHGAPRCQMAQAGRARCGETRLYHASHWGVCCSLGQSPGPPADHCWVPTLALVLAARLAPSPPFPCHPRHQHPRASHHHPHTCHRHHRRQRHCCCIVRLLLRATRARGQTAP